VPGTFPQLDLSVERPAGGADGDVGLVVVGRPLPGSDRAALQQPPVERLTRLLVLLVVVVVVVLLLLHRWRLHRHLWLRLLLLCKLLHPPLRRRPLHERRR